jgi:hypothetical protein
VWKRWNAGLSPDAGIHASGGFLRRFGDRARPTHVGSGPVVWVSGLCCIPTLGWAVSRSRRNSHAGPITRILMNDQGLRDVCCCSVRGRPYGPGCRSQSPGSRSPGAPERPEFRGDCSLLALAASLAECWLVLFCWVGSSTGLPAGLPVDGGFGVPDRAVGSSPGRYTTGCHRQSPAALMNEVMMYLA